MKKETNENVSTEQVAKEQGAAEVEEVVIPKSRFDQIWKQKKELEATLALKEQEIETLKGATVTIKTLEQKIKEMESAYQAKEAGWVTERELMQAGLLDEEGREIARFLHGRLSVEEGQEKPSVGAWIASLKEEGAEIPPALAPYLSAASSSTTEAKKGLPNANAHTRAVNPTGKVLNISQMTPEEYLRNRPMLLEMLNKQLKK